MKYYVETYGCQMNVYDSRKMEEMLLSNSLTAAESPEDAAFIIVNTCSVRDHAEQRALARIRELAKRKRTDGGLLAVCGCMAQRMGSELLRVPGVDMVLGPDSYSRLLSYVESCRTDGGRVVDTTRDESFRFQATESFRAWGLRAFVSIMKGCSNGCSFCVVPSVRGPAVSRSRNEVLKEVVALVDGGTRDITLIGQNVNDYGCGDTDFPGLLRDVAREAQRARIRFTTSHPKDMTRSVIDAVAECGNICEHIHLPLQSGSDRILEKMNRGYTKDRYRKTVEQARELLLGVSITTDIIVGFPGETETDFAETCSFVEEMQFDSAFMFKFSPRPGSAATLFPDDVPAEEKQRRLSRVIGLQHAVATRKSSGLVGREMEVLVEGPKAGDGPARLVGRTRCNRTTLFEGQCENIGKFVTVRIDSCKGVSLFGTLVTA